MGKITMSFARGVFPLLALAACGAAFAACGAAWAQTAPQSGSAKPPVGWFIRLSIDNFARGLSHGSAMLGQYTDAAPGYNARSLPAMPPFASPYLYIAFPHPEWGKNAGDYATDFRPMSDPAPSWTFEARGDPVGDIVQLRWQGDPAVIARLTLTEAASGVTIALSDPRFSGGVPITLAQSAQRYVLRLRPQGY